MSAERNARQPLPSSFSSHARGAARAFSLDRLDHRFHDTLRASYAPPAALIDARDRVVSTSGDLALFFSCTVANAERLRDVLRDDIRAEVRDVVATARSTGKATSGLVVILRRGPVACKLVATPIEVDGEPYVTVAFETPLAALAASMLPPPPIIRPQDAP